MANYQFKLTPIDFYFFGGEKHQKNNKGELEANYFVESRAYPQQTTILGFVRYFLLKVNACLLNKNSSVTQRNRAAELVGNKSFSLDKSDLNFGKITSLSALYFLKETEPYFFVNNDIQFEIDDSFQLKKENEHYSDKEHNKYVTQYLLDKNGIEIPVALSEVCKPIESQVGNKIAESGESKEKGFYKIKKMKLAKGWSFAFDVELQETLIDDKEYFLPFGGEKSIYKIEYKRQEAIKFIDANKLNRDIPFVLITSDAIIENMPKVDFAVNDFVSFRYLSSVIHKDEKEENEMEETQFFNNLPLKRKSKIETSSMKRNKRLLLSKRGSIFYFSEKKSQNEFIETLEKSKAKIIGFNQFINN